MSAFDKVPERRFHHSAKWNKYKGQDILPMWVADSDFEAAPAIRQALEEQVKHGVYGYAQTTIEGLNESVVHHLSKHYDWKIQKEWIVWLPSLVSGLNLTCKLAQDVDAEIISPATIYPPFKSAPQNSQHDVVEVPMILQGERWVLDFDALETAITPNAHTLLLCNPHNPGGTVYTREELERLHQICQQHDIQICSDEIHCDLILAEGVKHIPIAALNEDAAQRTITLMAASKTFNVAGLSCGFAIIPNAKTRRTFENTKAGVTGDINIFGQLATRAAFNECDDWLAEQIEYLRGNYEYLYQELNSLEGLKMYPQEATFLAWVDVSALNLDDPVTFFEKAGIGFSGGAYFGDNRFIRINFACPRSTLKEAVKRIKCAIN